MKLTALSDSGHIEHAMLFAGKVGNEYTGNLNLSTFQILQECQTHNHHLELQSDWNLSLVIALQINK